MRSSPAATSTHVRLIAAACAWLGLSAMVVVARSGVQSQGLDGAFTPVLLHEVGSNLPIVAVLMLPLVLLAHVVAGRAQWLITGTYVAAVLGTALVAAQS